MASSPDDRLFGSAAAVIVAAAVAVAAFAYVGWSTWLLRFLQLAAAYGVAHFALAVTRRIHARRDVRRDVALALVASAVGALAGTFVLRALNDYLRRPETPYPFDFWLAAAFVAALLVSTVLQREAVSRSTQDRQLAELRLSALQAQVEPHFLYNTLANVQQLVRSDAAAADRMLDSLVRYLKTSIPDVRSGRSTLGQEVARAEAYLSIMAMRMGARLRYEVDVPEALRDEPVPPLSVMTLVENAVKHGIDGKPAGGCVRVAAERREGTVRIRVTDDGAGFGSDAGDGTGLANLRDRLATMHGDRARLELSHAAPSGVEALLVLPVG